MSFEPSGAAGGDGEGAKEPISWTCKKCGEVIEGQFDSCWKCSGRATAGESGVSSALGETDGDSVPMKCSRCFARMEYEGRKAFREGGEWFPNYEHFDVYVCSRCGRVEFFVSGIGEEFRSRRGDG